MKTKEDRNWDVAVIGGGPAGMMAAGSASELGAKVVLLEKNESLGKKLLITGGGRCNVTNAELNTRVLLSKFKGNDKFLFSPFSQWGVKETLRFFNSRGMATKVEPEQRVFPMSNSAQSVWDVLVNYLRDGKVSILCNSPVTGFSITKDRILSARIKGTKEIEAKSFILATGGTSRPETGSTGDGFKWLREIGHTVIEPSVSLVPIAIQESWVKKITGVSLQDIKITLLQNNIKQSSKRGKVLFTHFGLSGPTILNMSSEIGELLKYGEVVISLDLFPTEDQGQLDRRLVEVFKEQSNKMFKNSLRPVLPTTLANLFVELSKIEPDRPCHSVTREQRLSLVKLLKDLRLTVKELLGVEKAVVTSGGIKLDEVDFKTMHSRLFENLYLVGDVLDIDRPSGGYSLQLCWTTGYVAGTSAAKES